MKDFFYVVSVVMMLVIICEQSETISTQDKLLNDWEDVSIRWRDSMDTCINRNHRLYYELESLKEYKLMKLQEDGSK